MVYCTKKIPEMFSFGCLILFSFFVGLFAQCGPNQVRAYGCQSACEPNCINPSTNQICTLQCVYRQCNCRRGYVRDRFGNCVIYRNCPRFGTTTRRPPSCADIQCSNYQICIMRNVQCFVPPCYPQPECVPWWYQYFPWFFNDQPQISGDGDSEVKTEEPYAEEQGVTTD